MLEILYDTAMEEVRAWCGDPNQFGNFNPKPEQAVVIFPIDPPSFESDWYKVDLVNEQIVGNPDYVLVEPFDVRAEIDEIKAILADHEGRLSRDISGHSS